MYPRTSSMVILAGILPAGWAGFAPAQQREAADLQPLPYPEIDAPQLAEWSISWWVILGGLLLLALLLTLIVVLLLRARVARPPMPPPHPLKRAQVLLQALQVQVETLNPDVVAHEVSTILRDYQQTRYRVPAPYLTTEELYDRGMLDARDEVRERFSPLARMYDRLSFGRSPATHGEAAALVADTLTALQNERMYLQESPPDTEPDPGLEADPKVGQTDLPAPSDSPREPAHPITLHENAPKPLRQDAIR